MNSSPARLNPEPLPLAAPEVDARELADGFRDNGAGRLPERWHQLPTALSETRLYRIAPPNGGETEWQAEMTLHGELQRRRCTSELRARAWLAIGDNPRFTLRIF